MKERSEDMRKSYVWAMLTGIVGFMCINGCSIQAPVESAKRSMMEESVEVMDDAVAETSMEMLTEEAVAAEEPADNEESIVFKQAPDVSIEMRSEQRFSEDWSTETVTFTYHEISVSPEEYQELADALAAYSQGRKAQLDKKADEMNIIAQNALNENADDFWGMYLGTQVVTKRSDSAIYSIMESEVMYGYDEHQNSYYGAVFDVDTGKHLELTDLCEDKNLFLNVVVNQCISDLQTAYPDAEFHDGFEQKIIENIENTTPWYMDATGLTFMYPNETIAEMTGLNGPMKAHVPYEVVEGIIKNKYLPVDSYGVTAVPINYPVLINVNGVEKEFCVHRAYTDDYSENISLSYGTQIINLNEYIMLKNVYLLKQEAGIYLLYDIDYASDDYETYLYQFTEDSVQEMDKIRASIDDANVNGDTFELGFCIDVLGTYTSNQTYYIDENGKFATDETEYEIKQSTDIKTIVNLTIEKDGKMTTLPAGSTIRIIATDDKTKATIVIVSTLEEATLYFNRREDNSFHIDIDGMDQFECFEMLPYAG